MIINFYQFFILLIIYFVGSGCAGHSSLPRETLPIPLEKVNLGSIIEQQQGLEISWEDAKDIRDFYRGGVQYKARAESKSQEGNYQEALKLYETSNEFLSVVLNYFQQDSAEYYLFEGHQILFFPNLLMADNNLKIGQILKLMKKDWAARRKWKQALSFAKKSLESEKTAWGLSIQGELMTLINQSSND